MAAVRDTGLRKNSGEIVRVVCAIIQIWEAGGDLQLVFWGPRRGAESVWLTVDKTNVLWWFLGDGWREHKAVTVVDRIEVRKES
jgi:hypothetical protein